MVTLGRLRKNEFTKERVRITKNLDKLEAKLKKFLKAHGGFVDTQPIKYYDTIYGYIYNESDTLTEQYVYAVRLVGDTVEVCLEPICTNTRIVYTKEDFDSEAANWYPLCETLWVPTLLSIVEAIFEYV